MSRRVRLRQCGCGRPLLVGLDHDRCGLPVQMDLAQLSPFGEAMALGAGLRTYEVDRAGAPWLRETPGQIRAARADTATVLAEHRCDIPIPNEWTRPTVIAVKKEISDEPSF